jgi:hypothetical protein
LRDTGFGDVGVSFDKEFHFLCAVVLARRYKQALFLLYPDRRHPTTPLREAREIMNRGVAKYGDKREFPFRRLAFADPERYQALQVVDIILGGVAYKLNGHYKKPEANLAKREFCDYLHELFKIKDLFYQSQLYKKDFFTAAETAISKAGASTETRLGLANARWCQVFGVVPTIYNPASGGDFLRRGQISHVDRRGIYRRSTWRSLEERATSMK